MDHAAAHEEMADLALEPHRLRRLAQDDAPEAIALRAHLAECARCRRELDAWRRVYDGLDVASGGRSMPLRSLESSEVPSPSPDLRARTLAAVSGVSGGSGVASGEERGVGASAGDRSNGQADRARERRRLPRPARPGSSLGRVGRLGWLAAAAAIVVAVGFGALLVQQTAEVDQARQEASDLGSATSVLDRVLAAPTHWVVTLHTADGAAGGTLAWSPSEMVVLTSALTPDGRGTTYRCWLERNGTRTPVGAMSFAGGVGYWAGSTALWGSLEKGSRFGVTAIPPGADAGPAVLVADL